LAIKIGLGKLTLSLPFPTWMNRAVTDLSLTILPITIECADTQSRLDNHHRDPFDRLLVAHALVMSAPLISSDPIFDRYGISRFGDSSPLTSRPASISDHTTGADCSKRRRDGQ
jgi:PIN domain nuclease of toxin-antitoxin system